MENNYRRTSTTVSMINYHFVFCPRYRRKIFLDSNLETRFKELVHEECNSMDLDIVALECDKDHVHLFVNSLPKYSPSDIMAKVKGRTSKIIREEFSSVQNMTSLWTRSYFVSTAGAVSTEVIKRYIEEQKTRG